MSSTHKEAPTMQIFLWLTILTILEIGVVFVPIPKLIIGIILIGLALGKASLVALYFMHLKYEKKLLGWIALTPLLICTLLIVALLPDLTASNKKNQKAEAAAAQQEIVEAQIESK